MKIHIVQKGDTLWEIAKKYGVDFEEIKQLNSQLASPDMIMPGMKIKIPSSVKPVKNESITVKETQKPKEVQQVIPPKPIQTIQEDDHKKPIKPEMPMQYMPQFPVAPMMQMPIMEQELHSNTTINLPEMPQYTLPKEEIPKKEEIKPIHHQQMPIPAPMVPMCCHMHHHCCIPMHHHCFGPMGHMPASYAPQGSQMQPMMPQQPMMQSPFLSHTPSMEMPVKPVQITAKKKDCGCNSQMPFPHHHQPGYPLPPFARGDQEEYQQPNFGQQQMQQYPPRFGDVPNNNFHPTPPGYPPFPTYKNGEEDDK